MQNPKNIKHNFTKCLPLFFIALLACSAQENTLSPNNVYTFQLGNQVIFSLNQWNELQQTPSPILQDPNKNFPKLTFSVQNRIVAELGTSDGAVVPPVFTSPYSPLQTCSLSTTLQKTEIALNRIANKKDIHTKISSHFASLSSCATQKALECFLEDINATNWNDLPTAALRGLTLKGIVTRLGSCTGNSDPWETKNYFTIADNQVNFYPAPANAIIIYPGEQKSYTVANDNTDCVVRAENILCQENCYDMLMPISELKPCKPNSKLEAGQTYTAFLQLTPQKSEDSFVPIVFVAQ